MKQKKKRSARELRWKVWGVLFIMSTFSVAEEQVIPLDPRLGPEIEREERDKYHLFPEVKGFIRAFVLETKEGYVLHLLYEREGKRYHETRFLSKSEWEELRRAVATERGIGGGGEGRLRLVTHGTIYGIFLYGVQTARLLEIEENRYRVGLWMLGAGAGFGTALHLTRDYHRGSGFAKMLTTGSYAGLYYGMLPDTWLDQRPPHGVLVVPKPDKRRILGAMLGVPAGMWIMSRLCKNREITDSEADATFLGAWAGVGYGLATAYLANAEERSELLRKRMYLGATATLLPVGGFLAYRLTHERALSSGQVWMASLGGALGVYSGATLVRLLDGKEVGESGKPYVWAMSLTFPVGVTALYRLTRDEAYSQTRAGIVAVGTVAGGLVGAGLVYVATNVQDSRPYLLASSLASMGALMLVHRSTQTKISSPESAWEGINPVDLAMGAAGTRLGLEMPPVRLMTIRF